MDRFRLLGMEKPPQKERIYNQIVSQFFGWYQKLILNFTAESELSPRISVHSPQTPSSPNLVNTNTTSTGANTTTTSSATSSPPPPPFGGGGPSNGGGGGGNGGNPKQQKEQQNSSTTTTTSNSRTEIQV